MNATTKRLGIAFLLIITVGNLSVVAGKRRVKNQAVGAALVHLRQGAFRLLRGRKNRIVRESTLLAIGDRVSIDRDSRAAIYQAYAPVNLLWANQSQTIAEALPPPPKNAISPEEYNQLVRAVLNAKERRKTRSPISMGGPKDSYLTVLNWRNDIVLERRPEFEWTKVKGAQQYVVTVYDRNQRSICTAKTTETRILFPTECPTLTPGEYKWEVIAKLDDHGVSDPALYDASAFTLVDDFWAVKIETDLARARAVIAEDRGSGNLVYVSALLSHRRYALAETYLKKSLVNAPQDQTLWALLMETYAQMRLWGSREAARRLSENPNLTSEMILAGGRIR